MKYIATFILWATLVVTYAQETIVRGKIYYNLKPLEGVHIQNIDNQEATTTDSEGSFAIKASKGHSLKCTFMGKKTIYRSVTLVDLQRIVVLTMSDVTIALEEVSVTERGKITAQSLGILQHTPKERSLQEKREYTHTNLLQADEITLYKLLVGRVDFNILSVINALSGETKIIKKEVVNEKNIKAAHYIINEMGSYLATEHHLTEEEIGKLAFYVMEKPEVHSLIDKGDKQQLSFMLYEYWIEMKP